MLYIYGGIRLKSKAINVTCLCSSVQLENTVMIGGNSSDVAESVSLQRTEKGLSVFYPLRAKLLNTDRVKKLGGCDS